MGKKIKFSTVVKIKNMLCDGFETSAICRIANVSEAVVEEYREFFAKKNAEPTEQKPKRKRRQKVEAEVADESADSQPAE